MYIIENMIDVYEMIGQVKIIVVGGIQIQQ